MKRNAKQPLRAMKRDVMEAAEKAGDVAEDMMEDVKHAIKRGRSKLKHKL